jgi:hypothetical protein
VYTEETVETVEIVETAETVEKARVEEYRLFECTVRRAETQPPV